MTLELRDLSDYDPDPVSFAGLSGVTHKATEGTIPDASAEGTKLAARLNAARSAGLPVLGSYHVLRTPGNSEPGGVAGSLAQQLAHWVARLDSQVPWWRTHPNWVMQVDAEKWSYDPDMPPNVLGFAALLAGSGLPGWKVTYASRGQYGDSLTGIPTALWNADYGAAVGAYPGDGATTYGSRAAFWAPYSGQVPVLLQFAGGPDMNAYRGSLADLLNLTGVGMTPEEHAAIIDGALTDENVLHWRLRAIMDQDDSLLAAVKSGRPSVPGLKQISEQIAALTAAVAKPAAVDTHALATDLLAQLSAAGFNSLTADGVHGAIVAALNGLKLTTTAQAT